MKNNIDKVINSTPLTTTTTTNISIVPIQKFETKATRTAAQNSTKLPSTPHPKRTVQHTSSTTTSSTVPDHSKGKTFLQDFSSIEPKSRPINQKRIDQIALANFKPKNPKITDKIPHFDHAKQRINNNLFENRPFDRTAVILPRKVPYATPIKVKSERFFGSNLPTTTVLETPPANLKNSRNMKPPGFAPAKSLANFVIPDNRRIDQNYKNEDDIMPSLSVDTQDFENSDCDNSYHQPKNFKFDSKNETTLPDLSVASKHLDKRPAINANFIDSEEEDSMPSQFDC